MKISLMKYELRAFILMQPPEVQMKRNFFQEQVQYILKSTFVTDSYVQIVNKCIKNKYIPGP